MMNPWVKRKWVRALRSGEYRQANGSLVTGNDVIETRYCCLGVLLAECRPASIAISKSVWSEKTLYVPEGDTQPSVDYIADDLAILFDLDMESQKKLAEMNDNRKPFRVIADWIEENL